MSIGRGNLNQLGGKMVFEHGKTPASGEGGCVNLARGGLVQTGGSILFSDCHTGSWSSGGALSVTGNLRQTDGQLLFYDCTSPLSGGALCVMGDATQEGGVMEFQKCYSEETGGGMYVFGDLTQLGGVIEFLQCATGSNMTLFQSSRGYADQPKVGGGALHIQGSLIQKAGSISADSCTTEGKGGGIFILNGDFRQTGGSTHLQNCTADVLAGGIGLQNGSLVQEEGYLWISDCHAGQAGGACSVQEGNVEQNGTGEILFDGCSSEGVGGGLCAFSRGSVKLMGKSVFQHCVAGMSGAALYSIAPTTVASSTIIDTTIHGQVSFFVRSSLVMENVSISSTLQQPFEALAREITITQPPNCSLLADGCQFTATSLQVPPPLCSQGTGVINLTTDGQSMIGCEKCPQGFMQLMDAKSEACRPCPVSAQICEPARVKMRPGYMVTIRSSINDLSPPRRCAAPKACPGRSLPDERSSMCAEGYAGDGCLYCDGTTHAAADGQSLSCTKCGVSRDSLPMEIAYLTAKMLGIFTIALLGGFAQKDEETTTSSILLNQLMAFSAAGLVAVGAAADTTAARADETLGSMLQTARQVLAVSQADLGLTSFECILSSAGLASSMGVAHVLSTALPTLVMLSAGMRYPYLALVAGSNCFLPGFAASVGKFVVVVPDVEVEETGEKSQLVMPDLPQGFSETTGVMFFGGLILLCFAAVGLGWSYVTVMTKESPTPAHVAYLRSAFNPDHSAAEVERMVRKMLFRLLPVLLPVGAYPASQMACASILLLLVLVTFMQIKPYREMWLNHVEIALMTIALLMVFMAKWLLSRDVEGTDGSAIDVFLLGTLASLGFTVGIGLTASLLWFLFGERQGRELLEDL
ncbi:pmpB [Symbiodinium sp. CCMP2456]|nr:pmpB [Symbiodinium sp. CCMP2456]